MATYRYLLTDLVTSARLAELPFTSVTYSHVLNGPGSFTGTMSLRQPSALEDVLSTALTFGRIALFIERDGVIVWGGPMWTDSTSYAGNTYTMNGEGWHSYFRRRYIDATKTYVQQDQTTGIAKNLIDYAQGVAGGNINVSTADVVASGVLRDRTYLSTEIKNIGEAIEQLAAVEKGFDFKYESRYDGSGNLTKRFLTQYPATGRMTILVFDLNTNLVGMTVQTDATALANKVYATGSENLIAKVSDPGKLASYPLYEDSISNTDVIELTTLALHANRRLTRGSAPIVIPDIDFDPSLIPTLGSFFVGDIVRVRGGAGFKTIDGLFHITEYSITVGDAGEETGRMSLAGMENF